MSFSSILPLPGTALMMGLAVQGLLVPGAAQSAPTADGIFATLVVKRGDSSLGEFSCRLEYEKVPRTVANFVGLAEGSRPFVDFLNGHAGRRPFYNGIVFHRVVAGFVIQAGSPKGDGSDGPGYTFPDEFDSSLRHNKAGILSMANSGLNSNGSQFFVTLASRPNLDDVHSVFGEVVEGMGVVDAVQQGDVIESVTIVRNGEAAQAFDVSAQGLPEVLEGNPALAKTPSGFELVYPQPANSELFVFHSGALDAWSQLAGKEMHGIDPLTGSRDVTSVTSGRPMRFFNVSRVDYPDAIYTPAAVAGKKLSLINNSVTGAFTLDFMLTEPSSGTYVLTLTGQAPLGPHPVSNYFWTREAYRGRLLAAISGIAAGGDPIVQANISFVFGDDLAGTYGGSFGTLSGQTLPLAGTFTMTDL